MARGRWGAGLVVISERLEAGEGVNEGIPG